MGHTPQAAPHQTYAARQAVKLQAAARLHAILECANSLLRDEYRIQRLDVQSLSVKPVIWIAVEPRLATLVERGVAVYYVSGCDQIGHYRVGQFERCGCEVQWIERGN